MRTSWTFAALLLASCSSASGGNPGTGLALPDSGADASREASPSTDAGHADVSAAPEAGGDSATGTAYPAAHPVMPQEVNLGGPVLKAPKFVVVTFAGDSLAPTIDDFVDKVAASASYWSGTTAEYGVGKVASVVHLTVTDTPAATLADTDVQTWISSKLTAGSGGLDAGTSDAGAPDAASDAALLEAGAAWPQPDAETLYMIYYPDGVTITQGGGSSCSSFYGYHNDYAITPGAYVAYSVIARCAPFPQTSLIDSIASVASHELVEAATDPFPQDNPAWAQPDSDHTAWAIPAGGELGDLCAAYGNVFYKPSDVPYLVQRTWSNKAAAAGHDPCQPAGASPYFNAAPVLTDTLTINDPTLGTYTTKGIKVPVGGTATVELDLYSDGPTSTPFAVQPSDLSSLFGGPQQLQLSIGGQASATGQNGDKLQLTVKVLAQGTGASEVLWIQNTLGASTSVWVGLVGN